MNEGSPLQQHRTRSSLLLLPKKIFSLRRFISIVALILVCASIIFVRLQPRTGIEITNHLPNLTASAKEDIIHSLPGLPSDFFERHYSGYLNLNCSARLHYWFVESQDQPSSDPVVLWLNGGPGASSLGGLLNENGPFIVNDDGASLRRNPFSWNRHANMLYFEAPVGVGFSYNISGRYETNDFMQAIDSHEALVLFFKKFPQLLQNEFFVAGESYGGVYVPTLAKAIVEKNKIAKQPESRINLVGIAVGNGVNEYSANSQMFFAYYHGLFGHDMWQSLRKNCPEMKEFTEPSFNFFDAAMMVGNGKCAQARLQAFTYMMSSHINNYDIYSKCSHGDPNYGIDTLIKKLLEPQNGNISGPNVAQPISLPMSLCLNITAGTNYLNRAEVKRAIHVPDELTWGNIVMTNISSAAFNQLNISIDRPILNYGMTLQAHVVPIWQYLLNNSIRTVIYHGDVDFMCDFIGGQWAVESMNLTIKAPYQPWHTLSRNGINQTSGFVKEFDKDMTFVTVKGAGHMVPQWKPAEALHMFEKFVLRSKIDV